jgi:hypothetical protein
MGRVEGFRPDGKKCQGRSDLHAVSRGDGLDAGKRFAINVKDAEAGLESESQWVKKASNFNDVF